VREAVAKLPWPLRGIAEPTVWETRAATHAQAAVDRLRPGATRDEMEAAAADALKSVEAEYDTARAAERDAAERERLLMWLPLELREFTEEGQGAAREAIQRAWAECAAVSFRSTTPL